ncbi:lysylphosphatidylglycerol synthase domain-containing protein [Rubricoccus marinus]|uniref:TIGR00374 family protein n=1 Tax=Rubricoccus marinus TaxID=716817 RepID=A0A259TYA4_9BACT|nr:lysylphosphatidylglycerol synthase domain-containing protein [Rubricoccus marinus]OZC02554.1 hypothetical protein BSZ36_05925 [Rubricoccus marinus]
MPPVRSLLRAAAILIPIGVAANVAISLATTDRALLASLADVPLATLGLVLGLSAVPWLTQSARMTVWSWFVGRPLRFWTAFRLYAGGVLGSAVTPTAVGGGSIRWALATRHGVPGGTAATLLTVEGIQDILFIALAIPAALAFSSAGEDEAIRGALGRFAWGVDAPAVIIVGSGVALGLLSWALFRAAARGRLGGFWRGRALRLGARLRRPVVRGARDVRRTFALVAARGKGPFALTFLLTAIQWTARYSVATVVIAALGGPFQPLLFWLLGWMTYAVSSAAPTPGAAGAAEATFALLHAPFVGAGILGLTAAVWRLVLFYLPAAVAAFVYPLFVVRDAIQPSED